MTTIHSSVEPRKHVRVAAIGDGDVALDIGRPGRPAISLAAIRVPVADLRAALNDFAPAVPYTRTDEKDWQAHAERAERALAEMTVHRDQCRDTAIKWQVEANRAVQARPITPDAITDEMVERGARQYIEEDYTSWERSPALAKNNARESVRGILEAALTEPPPRPEGAAELHQVLDAIYQDEPGITHRGNFADMLATYGVRVASVDLTPTNPEEQP